MKKFIVLLLFISFCGGTTEETVDQVETTTSTRLGMVETTTTTTVPFYTEDDLPKVVILNCPKEILDDDFEQLDIEISNVSNVISRIYILINGEETNHTYYNEDLLLEENEEFFNSINSNSSSVVTLPIGKFTEGPLRNEDIRIFIGTVSLVPDNQEDLIEIGGGGDGCVSKYVPYQINQNTLLPKIKELSIVDYSIPLIEVVIEQGYAVDESALSDKRMVEIEFKICDLSKSKTIENNIKNFYFCDGSDNIENVNSTLTTFSFDFPDEYSYFQAEIVDKYTVKYTLGLFKEIRELNGSDTISSIFTNEDKNLFYQLKEFKIWDIKNYGDPYCDIRLDISFWSRSYRIWKPEGSYCPNLESGQKYIYDIELLEFNDFNEYWNGTYFNGLPSFKMDLDE
jgi:hypothetical protein